MEIWIKQRIMNLKVKSSIALSYFLYHFHKDVAKALKEWYYDYSKCGYNPIDHNNFTVWKTHIFDEEKIKILKEKKKLIFRGVSTDGYYFRCDFIIIISTELELIKGVD